MGKSVEMRKRFTKKIKFTQVMVYKHINLMMGKKHGTWLTRMFYNYTIQCLLNFLKSITNNMNKINKDNNDDKLISFIYFYTLQVGNDFECNWSAFI